MPIPIVSSELVNKFNSADCDRAKVTPKLPHLWVTDIIAAQPLVALGTFAGVFSLEVPIQEATGDHILCLDPDTPEVEWKTIGYELINQGCQVNVCQLGVTNYQPLEWYLKEVPVPEVAVHIITQETTWKDWVKRLDTPLQLEEALDLAELAFLKIQDNKQRNVELERLRVRLGMNEFRWDKKLEEIKANLERTLGLPATTNRTRDSRYKQRYEAIKQLWDGSLRLNTLKQQAELDGEPLDLDFVRSDLCLELNMDIPKEEAIEIVLNIARKNQYCPIVEYLEKVSSVHPNPSINFDKLALSLLGTSDPLHAVYLKRHLIGSVARALNPGCKMDTALILQGDQGIGKSSFFRSLYGDDFFDDTMAESSDKDELMKLHQHWAVEWAEFETQLSRKGYSRLKQFMSTKVDNYRAPYARTPKAFKRRSILVGSTNELEFLNDPSGDRRYWVIPLGDTIDLSLTEQLRDQIWAAAVAAYRAGEKWHLTPEEKKLADEANKPFRTSDTWEDYILAYVQDRQFVTIGELLTKALELDPSKQDKGSQIRAAAILRRLGWDKAKSWINGTWKRGWVNPNRSNDPSLPELDREFQGLDRCQEVNEINTFSHTDPTDPILDQHLAKKADGLEVQTEESLNQVGSVDRVESLEACKIDVSPTDPPLVEVKVGQWIKFQDRIDSKDVVAQISESANEHGLYGYRQLVQGKEFIGGLYRHQFTVLSKEEVCRLGLTSSPVRPLPYHPKTNPPKKGDRVRSCSGKAGQITLTRSSNPRYEITWEDGRIMGFTFKDLEDMDIRRES